MNPPKRSNKLVKITHIGSTFFITFAISITTQTCIAQRIFPPPSPVANRTVTPRHVKKPASTPAVIEQEATEGYQLFPEEEVDPPPPDHSRPQAQPSPSPTPADPDNAPPPDVPLPSASPTPPTPPPPATPSHSRETPPAGQQPAAPIPEHQHRPLLPWMSRPPPRAVIEEQATTGYEIFPRAQVTTPPKLCAPHPGYGPGERVLFPPPSGPHRVWTLFYLNKNREFSFALPMSEGVWGSGDWFRLRHTLVDEGITFIGSYGSDIQGNVSGGLSPGFGYADCIDFRLSFDLQRLVGWKGAHFVISGLDRNGSNLSKQHIGNQFTVAQIWGDQTINFYALWLEQDLFDGWWNFKLGRIAGTDDFSSNPLIYGLYVNNAIDGQPMALPVNGYISAYPAAVWGARFRFNDKLHDLYAMFGIYQTTNRLYEPAYHGLDFSIRKNDGMNLIWEMGWIPEFQPHPEPPSFRAAQPRGPTPSSVLPETWHGLPGHYKFGVFYTPWRDIPQFIPSNTFYSYGFYWLFDQMIYQAAPGTTRGLTLWTVFVYSPQQNTSKMPFQFSAGLVYTGLIPYRSKDQLVFGAFYTTFSNDYAATQQAKGAGYPTYEWVLEFGYRINLSSFFYIEPDLQYVINPGGAGTIPNAFVVGAQIGFSF